MKATCVLHCLLHKNRFLSHSDDNEHNTDENLWRKPPPPFGPTFLLIDLFLFFFFGNIFLTTNDLPKQMIPYKFLLCVSRETQRDSTFYLFYFMTDSFVSSYVYLQLFILHESLDSQQILSCMIIIEYAES